MPLPSSGSPLSRRRFLALTGSAVAAAGTVSRTLAAAPANRSIPIGIELYAVRGELARDLPQTLREVARIGYEAVEFYSPYFDWTPAYARQVRGVLDELGLRCLSTHNHVGSFTPDGGVAKAIELNQILGSTQIVLASAPSGTEGVEGWTRLAAQLSDATAEFQRHGLTGGFHNHQVEWAKLPNGQRIMDLLAAQTPSEFVLQLDVGTCVDAGADPVAWIRAHPGRIRSIHLKDWAPGTEGDEKQYRVLFGEGVAPWREIITAAEAVGGVEVYLMEQEGSRFSEFETAARCLARWRELRRSV